MDAITVANGDSDLYRALTKSVPIANPFIYGLTTSVGMYSPQIRQSTTQNAVPSSRIQYTIPRSGLLRNMWLRFTVPLSLNLLNVVAPLAGPANTVPAVTDNLVPPYAVLNFIDYVEIATRTNAIQRLYPHDILDWIKSQSYDRSSMWMDTAFVSEAGAVRRAALTTVAPPGPAHVNVIPVFTQCIPLPFSFSQRSNYNIDTQVCEPLTLNIYFKSIAEAFPPNYSTDAANAANANLITTVVTVGSDIKCEAVYDFVTLGPTLKSAFLAALSEQGERGVSRLMYNSVQEKYIPNTTSGFVVGVTEATVDIRCRYPVFRVIIDFYSNPVPTADTAAAYATAVAGTRLSWQVGRLNTAKYPPTAGHQSPLITTIELLSSGVPIRKWFTDELTLLANSNHHRRRYDQTQSKIQSWVVNLGLSDDKGDQTGFLPMRHVTDLRWRFTFAAPNGFILATAATDSIVCTYQYFQEETIEPVDGNINVIALS